MDMGNDDHITTTSVKPKLCCPSTYYYVRVSVDFATKKQTYERVASYQPLSKEPMYVARLRWGSRDTRNRSKLSLSSLMGIGRDSSTTLTQEEEARSHRIGV